MINLNEDQREIDFQTAVDDNMMISNESWPRKTSSASDIILYANIASVDCV